MKGSSKVKISAKNLEKYAGVRRFRYGEAELEDLVGITTGLAWTEVGGELLQVEAVLVPGRGRVSVTGKLGDVMQESVQAANAYVRSRAAAFGIKPNIFEKRDIHVHVPEGATPKDGPSAGVAMITSIVSALTGIAVRKEVAMTGEISLRGRVMPIGGLKEKLLAALRGGLKTVLIPKENERDLPEIPDNVKKGLEIVPVSTVDEVLARALVKPLTAIEWPNDLEPVPAKPAESRPRSAPTERVRNRTGEAPERSGASSFWAPFVRSGGAGTRKIWYSTLTPFCRPPLHLSLPDFAGDRW